MALMSMSSMSSSLGMGNLYLTVHTHSPGAIFFGCEKGGHSTWAFAHLNEALSHKFFNLPPELSMLNGVEVVIGKVG